VKNPALIRFSGEHILARQPKEEMCLFWRAFLRLFFRLASNAEADHGRAIFAWEKLGEPEQNALFPEKKLLFP